MRSHQRTMLVVGLAAALHVVAMATTIVRAQQRPAAAAPAQYTEAQAKRGEALYADNCSYCHLVDLSGGRVAPALTGVSFIARWTNRPLSDLFDYMRTAMPFNSPGGLSAQQNADVLAFLLRKANYAPGTSDLPAQSQALGAMKLADKP